MIGEVPSSHDIDRAVELLVRGEVLALPTDTVPGMLKAMLSPTAPRRLNELKGRPSSQPVAMLAPYGGEVHRGLAPLAYRARLGRYFPGPLTAVVRRELLVELSGLESTLVPYRTVGVRVVASYWLSELIRRLGGGVWATSANPTGEKPSLDNLPSGVVVMRASYQGLGVASMVVDLTDPAAPKVLRPFDHREGVGLVSPEAPLVRARQKLIYPGLFELASPARS